MQKFIKFYLYFLPFFSLLGILLSISRVAFSDSYLQAFILIGAIIDMLIVFFGRKHLANRVVLFVLFLLIVSLLVGLMQENEISRRYITDFTNPFFFFSKIYIFSAYWKKNDFKKFIVYYTKVSFLGSIVLLPITYFLFALAGATRLSIFPPMELPFSYFMKNNLIFFMISFIIILLYGKRAQLLGAIVTFLLFVFYFNKKNHGTYLLLIIVCSVGLFYGLTIFSDNLAVHRILYTLEQFTSADDNMSRVSNVASVRKLEVDSILREMNSVFDFIFGKGLGFTYYFENTGNYERANAHFSPISFLSKYGIFFTIFIYSFLLSVLFKRKKKYSSLYTIANITCLFVFLESFFAYALFVTPIFVVVFGYILNEQKNSKIL